MELKRLTVEHYDELLSLLNSVFGRKYGHVMDFERELPVMWQRDEAHMHKHIGVFEDGVLQAVVGIYPLPATIDDREFLFATVGNMATRPEAEGKGYMSLLYNTATEELTRMGVDMARLGGARQRYERFGFTCGGVSTATPCTPATVSDASPRCRIPSPSAPSRRMTGRHWISATTCTTSAPSASSGGGRTCG